MASFALIMNLKRRAAERQESHTSFSSRAAQDFRSATFRASTFGKDLAETSLSRMDQIAKSIWLISGLDEG